MHLTTSITDGGGVAVCVSLTRQFAPHTSDTPPSSTQGPHAPQISRSLCQNEMASTPPLNDSYFASAPANPAPKTHKTHQLPVHENTLSCRVPHPPHGHGMRIR